jgi:hypothetical protein
VACAVPPAQAAALARQCDAVASTLRLRRATAYPIGPSEAYAGTLNSTLGGLQQATEANQTTLQQSQTLAGQAAAAEALATAYKAAASQLSAIRPSPADGAVNARLVSALQAAARAYTRAAGAARSGDADSYRVASTAIPGATAQVNTALAEVRAAGYKPAGSSQPSPPAAADSKPSQSADPESQSADPESDVGDSRSDDPSDDSAEP